MPKQDRIKTQYPGVLYVEGTSPATGKRERIYYIRYRKDGKLVEEKAGRQFQHDMTAARAAALRAERILGHAPTNEERREEAERQAQAESHRMTINRLWGLYLENKPSLKGKAQDESRYRRYLAPTFGDKEPSQIAPLDIDRLRLRLLKTYSPQTVKHVLVLLRRLIRFGASKGLCQPLPFQMELPPVNNETTEDLTPEQLARLIEACRADPHPVAGTMIRLAIYTGMRKGELLSLTWAAVDLERGFLRIVQPKGGRDAIIPINAQARELLATLPRMEGSDLVFPGSTGKRRVETRRFINRIRKAAGLPPDFRPLHGLRHHFASALASSGEVDMYVLQRLLTHKSPTTTARYSHLRDQALRKASELAGQLAESTAAPPAKVVPLRNGITE